MSTTFHYDPANHHGVRHFRYRRLIVGAVAVFAAAGATYSAASASTPSHQPRTPNECIALNGGDYNACNVGNSGRGDLPYQPVSPNQPINVGPGRP